MDIVDIIIFVKYDGNFWSFGFILKDELVLNFEKWELVGFLVDN